MSDVSVKKRLQVVAAAAKVKNEPLLHDLARDALVRIEHLEEYAQHLPACRLIRARLSTPVGHPMPDQSMCSCGLYDPVEA